MWIGFATVAASAADSNPLRLNAKKKEETMNRIMKAARPLVRKAPFTSRISGVITLVWIAALMFGATNANAACGLTGTGSGNPIRYPMLAQAANDQDDGFAPAFSDSIVGLWHVVYTADGNTFNETFDQWHSDGTEFENAWLPPDVGNICFGVWKEIAPRTVRLHHIGWTFTPGSTPPTASGTFTLDETNKVSRDGRTYAGTFIFKTYDINGTTTGMKVEGTIAATRITVN